jgi:Sulfotransferase family
LHSLRDPAVARYVREVPWAREMRGACKEWCDHVEAAMAFCDEHLDRATVVRYEDLVAEPQATFGSTHRFLGIADEEGPARFLASRRINSSFGERPRPSGSELWENWEGDQRHTFAEVAGPTMLRCGYATPDELTSPRDVARRGGAFRLPQRRGLMKGPDYARLVSRVREVVETEVPPNALVLVATRGDDGLLAFEGRGGWHFPRDPDGGYAGYYPADSEAAIAHLEELRRDGATHLVLPASGFWWLDYYRGLHRHLEDAYRRIRSDERVIMYDITGERPRSTRKAWSMVSRWARGLGQGSGAHASGPP